MEEQLLELMPNEYEEIVYKKELSQKFIKQEGKTSLKKLKVPPKDITSIIKERK